MTVCQAWWRREITHNECLIITLMMNLPWPLQNMLWICMCNKYKNIVTYQSITQRHRKWCEKCVIAWVIEQQGVKTDFIIKQPLYYSNIELISFKIFKKSCKISRKLFHSCARITTHGKFYTKIGKTLGTFFLNCKPECIWRFLEWESNTMMISFWCIGPICC